MRILKLKASNIKRLVAVEISPKGDVVKISGPNEAGKTSVLDAIWWALGGQDTIQSVPIRQGEKEASIEIDLGDMVVKRKFTESGSYLSIENKQGLKYPSPQKMLDDLVGRLAFDPLEFMRQDTKKQFATLRQLTGIDFTDLDVKRKQLFDERTVKNREVKNLEARHVALEVPADAPREETSSADILARVDAANAVSRLHDEYKAGRMRLAAQIAGRKTRADALLADLVIYRTEAEQQIEAKKREIADILRRQTEREKATHDDVARLGLEIEADTKAMANVVEPPPVPDIKAMHAELALVDDRNKAARALKEKDKIGKELEAAERDASALSGAIDAIDGEKELKISQAKFPLPGLGFGDGVVTYNGLPMDQASQAQQIRISMAMAMALNPKLRVIRITDGSLLDSKSLAIVEEMAKGGDFQVWMEVVDESGKVGVVIEDGKVAAVNDDQKSAPVAEAETA